MNNFKPELLNCVPNFDGNPNDLNRYLATCQSLIDNFYIITEPNNFQNVYLLNCLFGKLSGNAKLVINVSNVSTWKELKETLYRNFADQRDEACLNRDLVMLRQSPNESPNQFYDKILHILNLLCSFVDIHETEQNSKNLKRKLYTDLALKTYLSGLREPLGTTIRCMRPTDLPTALQYVTQEHNTKYLQNFQNIPKLTVPVHKPPSFQPRLFQMSKFQPQNFRNNFQPQFSQNTPRQPFNAFNMHTPYNSFSARPSFPSQPIPIRPNFNNIPHRFPTNSQVFGKPNQNSQTNVFKPNPNQPFPKPTPMSISTRQTSNIKPNFNNNYPPPQKFVSEELCNTQMENVNQIDYEENNFQNLENNDENNYYEYGQTDMSENENYSEHQQQFEQYTQPDENFQDTLVTNTDT
ncbi:probable serine/threonine-protein kinase DDB_G0276461 [Sitophilus oryzae]|uniref:Probable serine/threonine-protein kinase DDB_G0276461 n=1 Tax=Sitophilus oryzae TaxID=7048 RepID=A0A6J2YGM5_SITOR|nr:probable serine/threonine-protein kinase DDB_G0276461 [Sitophilus oryzae]